MKYGAFNYIQLNRGYGAYEQANESLGKSKRCERTGQLRHRHGVSIPKGAQPAGAFHVQWGVYQPYWDSGHSYHHARMLTDISTDRSVVQRSDRYNDWGLTPRIVGGSLPDSHSTTALDMSISASSTTTFEASIPISTTDRDPHTSSRCERLGTVAPISPIGELWRPSWGTVGRESVCI